MDRRKALTIFGAAGLALAGAARAATFSAFEQGAFDKLKGGNQPILLHVAASWCETCAAQRAVLDALKDKPDYKAVQIITIDFDAQKDIMREFKVTQRSTLIGFKDGKEVGRFTGNTKAVAIEALLKKII